MIRRLNHPSRRPRILWPVAVLTALLDTRLLRHVPGAEGLLVVVLQEGAADALDALIQLPARQAR